MTNEKINVLKTTNTFKYKNIKKLTKQVKSIS